MRLILRHGLRNSLIPVVTVVGLYTGTLIGNSVLTEIIFNRPGLGKLILAALDQRDYTLLQGLMVIFGICVVVINALTDIAYGFIDPRVRYDRWPPPRRWRRQAAASGAPGVRWADVDRGRAAGLDRAGGDRRPAAGTVPIRSSRTSSPGSPRHRRRIISAPTPTGGMCCRACCSGPAFR